MKNIELEFKRKQDGAILFSQYAPNAFPSIVKEFVQSGWNEYDAIKTLLQGHLNALEEIEYFIFSWQDEQGYKHVITNRKEEE